MGKQCHLDGDIYHKFIKPVLNCENLKIVEFHFADIWIQRGGYGDLAETEHFMIEQLRFFPDHPINHFDLGTLYVNLSPVRGMTTSQKAITTLKKGETLAAAAWAHQHVPHNPESSARSASSYSVKIFQSAVEINYCLNVRCNWTRYALTS